MTRGGEGGCARCLGWGAGALLVLLLIVAWRLGPAGWTWWRADAATAEGQLAHLMVFELRLPRVLAALLAGAALGVSGMLFQALTRNPLAAPDILGVTGGAQLGVFAALMLPALGGVASVPLLFGSGLLGALLTFATAGGWRASLLRLILAGSACTLFFNAVAMVLLAIFEDDIASVALWSNGVLYQPGAQGLWYVARWLWLPVLTLPFLLRSLEVSALGDDAAHTLGVPLKVLRWCTLVVATLLAAGAISVAGPMGFVGLMAPNLLRAAGVQRLHWLTPLSAVWGGLMLLAADSVVLALHWDAMVSTGVMVAVVGTPLLLLLVHRHRFVGGTESSVQNAPHRPQAFGRVVGLCGLLMVALVAFSVAYGEEWLSPVRWWRALLGQDAVAALWVDLRLYRVLTAMLAGALLAASGSMLQSVVRNPLAGPEVLGITQGAGLAVLWLLVTLPMPALSQMLVAAMAGGGTVLSVTLWLNRRHRLAAMPVALTGMALGGLCAALSQWLVVQSHVQQARLLVWLVGGTYGRSAVDAATLLPWLLLALPFVYVLARPLDLLALGEQSASALGVAVGRLRLIALGLATVLASVAVAVVGPVAFVGLVTPHLARQLGFHAHRKRLPVAMLLGALLLGLADVLGRSIWAPTEVPSGAMTALMGAPYLLGMLAWGSRQRQAGARV